MAERIRNRSRLDIQIPYLNPEIVVRDLGVYQAEGWFLDKVAASVSEVGDNDIQRWEKLGGHLEDVVSTAASLAVVGYYGLNPQGCPRSLKVIGGELNLSGPAVKELIRVSVQSLLLLHQEISDQVPPSLQAKLRSRYPAKESMMGATQRRIYSRALGNVGYYHDRMFVIQEVGPLKLLNLVRRLYGERTMKVGADLYRIGPSRDQVAYERRGCLSSLPRSVTDEIEAVRATAEHLAGLGLGTRSWTGPGAGTKKGFKRKGKYFPAVLAEYRRQKAVAVRLSDSKLEFLQLELLRHTTQARLRGEPKSIGLQRFNQANGTKYDLTAVKALEDQVLGEGNATGRLKILGDRDQIISFLNNDRLQRRLIGVMREVFNRYHDKKEGLSPISDDYSGINNRRLSEVRILIEKLVLGERQERGAVSPAAIEELFGETVPSELIGLLTEYAVGRATRTAITQRLGLSRQGLGALIQLIKEIDEQDDFWPDELTEEEISSGFDLVGP